MTDRSNWAFVGLAIATVAAVVLATFVVPGFRTDQSILPKHTTVVSSITDYTSAMHPVFEPGIILALGSNDSDAYLGGIGVYIRSTDYSLPVLASVVSSGGALKIANSTDPVNQYFWAGGVYGVEWNGSGWLVAGQASYARGNFGAMVEVQGSHITNLTRFIAPYFGGGGVYAIGWNGSAWLIGGNASWGIVLVAFSHGVVTNLTSRLPIHTTVGWLQLIRWNGDAWLVGGQGVLCLMRGSTVTDLFPRSPFAGSGVYTADWNGSAWLIGGGAGKLVIVQGNNVLPGPAMPPRFDQSVLMVLWAPGLWLIGGKGTAAHGSFAPALASWTGASAGGLTDLTAMVPPSFVGGEIQGGGWGPAAWGSVVLLGGEGAYNTHTGYGSGAVAVMTLHES